MEVDRVAADRGPQPGSARPVFPAKLLDAPACFVGMAQRRLVLVREDRLGHGLEQRHEALQAVGQRPGRDRHPLAGEPRGNASHGAEAGTVLEQEARPEAGPIERSGEQPGHRGRRHFHGRGRALAGPAPARTADHAFVGLDLDLDEGGFLGAVRHIGLPALCADAGIGRRVVLFGALLEPGPRRAAVAGRAALLAALAFRARLVLLLALAPVELLRQHGPGRAQLRGAVPEDPRRPRPASPTAPRGRRSARLAEVRAARTVGQSPHQSRPRARRRPPAGPLDGAPAALARGTARLSPRRPRRHRPAPLRLPRRRRAVDERRDARTEGRRRAPPSKDLPHRLHRSCRHPDYAAPVARTLAGTGRRARNVGIIRGI